MAKNNKKRMAFLLASGISVLALVAIASGYLTQGPGTKPLDRRDNSHSKTNPGVFFQKT